MYDFIDGISSDTRSYRSSGNIQDFSTNLRSTTSARSDSEKKMKTHLADFSHLFLLFWCQNLDGLSSPSILRGRNT